MNNSKNTHALHRLPEHFKTPIKVVFTDVDDTLTWKGKLPAETFVALQQLKDAGIIVVPVTGASAGWCDCIVRTWPVDTVIGENGSFWMERNEFGYVSRYFRENENIRQRNTVRLKALEIELTKRFPEISYTHDQPFRLTDIAFDIGQQVRVPAPIAQAATQWLLEQGVCARISSIHINAWVGKYNKADTAKAWLKQRLPDVSLEQCAFIGDSPNDESMFEHFPFSVGVSNIRTFLQQMQHAPFYITENHGGYGFVEFAEKLLTTPFQNATNVMNYPQPLLTDNAGLPT
jgi:HAD superfamily hydrolase (TIGR01484 family)